MGRYIVSYRMSMVIWLVMTILSCVFLVVFMFTSTVLVAAYKEIQDKEHQIQVQEYQKKLMAGEAQELRDELSTLKREAQALEEEKEALAQLLTAPKHGDWKVASAVISAYSPLDDRNGINSQGDSTKTSIGLDVGEGIFAVDPAKIPYGSEIVIVHKDGTKERGIAGDTGGALRNKDIIRIDVFRESYDVAMDYGMPEATVLWKEPDPSP